MEAEHDPIESSGCECPQAEAGHSWCLNVAWVDTRHNRANQTVDGWWWEAAEADVCGGT